MYMIFYIYYATLAASEALKICKSLLDHHLLSK